MRSQRERSIEAGGWLIGHLLVAPPCIIWALAQCGFVMGYSWRTWLAVALLHSYFTIPLKIKTEPW
jgi:hypothetical protein